MASVHQQFFVWRTKVLEWCRSREVALPATKIFHLPSPMAFKFASSRPTWVILGHVAIASSRQLRSLGVSMFSSTRQEASCQVAFMKSLMSAG